MIEHSVARFNSIAKKKTPPLPPPPTTMPAKADVNLDLRNNLIEYTKPEAVIQLRKTIAQTIERK